MDRSELSFLIKQDVKNRVIRWELVQLIEGKSRKALEDLAKDKQFNLIEAKRGLQLHILSIDKLIKQNENKNDP